MRDAAIALIIRAQEAGAIRADITPGDVLSLTAGVAWVSERTGDPPAAG